MRTDTFGQIEIPGVILGIGKEFLQPGMEMLLEFFEGEPISDVSPGVTSVRVATTASSSHFHHNTRPGKKLRLRTDLPLRSPFSLLRGKSCALTSRPAARSSEPHEERECSA